MQITGSADTARRTAARGSTSATRSLLAACLAHALHDGYTDGLYAFLPVWQTQFGLSYAGLAVVRALYYGTMGGLQVPIDTLSPPLFPSRGPRSRDPDRGSRLSDHGLAVRLCRPLRRARRVRRGIEHPAPAWFAAGRRRFRERVAGAARDLQLLRRPRKGDPPGSRRRAPARPRLASGDRNDGGARPDRERGAFLPHADEALDRVRRDADGRKRPKGAGLRSPRGHRRLRYGDAHGPISSFFPS